MQWLLSNFPSIILSLALVGVIALIIASAVKNKKRAGGCNGNCASCPRCSSKK